MINVFDIERELNEKMNFFESLVPEKRRYYHAKSIRNFIFHYKDLRNLADRERIYYLINSYFEFCSSNVISNIYDSLKVYNDFIKPIGEYYCDHLGFIVFVKPWIMIFNWCVLLIGCYLADANHLIFQIIFCTGVLYSIYIINKFRQKKVFAFLF